MKYESYFFLGRDCETNEMTDLKKSHPCGIKRTMSGSWVKMANRTVIYLPLRPKSHKMTESETERLQSMKEISRSFNCDLTGFSEGENRKSHREETIKDRGEKNFL